MVRTGRRFRIRFAPSLRRVTAFLAGTIVLLLVLSALPPVRGKLLSLGLRVADRRLPGSFVVGDLAWPAPGTLRAEDLVWFAESPDSPAVFGDTLLHVREIELAVDLGALRSHDLRIDRLAVHVGRLDLPALNAELGVGRGPAPPDSTVPPSAPATVPWLRSGAARDVPSLALQDFAIDVERAVLTADLSVAGVRLAGDLDAAHGAPRMEMSAEGRGRIVGPGPDFPSVDLRLRALRLGYGPERGSVALDTCSIVAGPVVPPDAERTAAGGHVLRLAVSGAAGLKENGAADVEVRAVVAGAPVALAGDHWPADLPTADYDSLQAELFVLAFTDSSGTVDGEVHLDAVGSPGWGRARALARVRGDRADPAAARIALDSLDLEMPGLVAGGAGGFGGGVFDLVAHAAVESPVPLLGAAWPEAAGADLSGRLDVALKGSAADPRGALDLRLRYAQPRATLTDLHLSAAGGRDSARVRLTTGRIGSGGRILADSVALDAFYRADRAFPFRAGFEAMRDGAGLSLSAAAALDSVTIIRLDSASLGGAEPYVRLLSPVNLRWDQARRSVSLDSLLIGGEPGTVVVAGVIDERQMRMSGRADLRFPEDLLLTIAPAGPWSRAGGMDLLLRGAVELAGERRDPDLSGRLELALDPHRDHPGLRAELEVATLRADSQGVAAVLTVASDDSTLVRGRAFLPGRLDPVRGGWTVADGRELVVAVDDQAVPLRRLDPFLGPDLGIRGVLRIEADLRRPLVPLRGQEASGIGAVSGAARGDRIQLSLPNGSRAELAVECRLDGPPDDPRLFGRIRVISAFLRIPEAARGLHDADGDALLWRTVGTDADSTSFEASPDTLAAQGRLAAPVVPDLDLAVEMPGNLRIHGHGLEAELAGKVAVARGRDEDGRPGPSLTGEVRTLQGSLRLMNRVFEIERGEILFTGAVPADPELSLLLAVEAGGVTVKLQVDGRLAEPAISLRSEPEMNEADIMAYLVFGRPLNDLDGDERSHLREDEDPSRQLRANLAALALAFGTQDLRGSVSSAIGVDMVDLGSDSQGGSTLTAGRFFGPRILLKYHHALENTGSNFMTLEYFLTRMFRLVSTYGQGEEASGVEVRWSLRR